MARLIWVTRASSLWAISRKCLDSSSFGSVLQEIEEVGDGVERVVDLVRDGGGEASGDGQLLVGEQGGAGAALHGDVAEDHDDAGESRRPRCGWARRCRRWRSRSRRCG